VTAHSISFSNLNANTLYHFAVTSSENGTSTISGDNMFTTPAVATTSSPTISVSVGVPNAYGSPFGSGGGSASTGGVLTTSSTAELQAELNALLAELATLEAEANGSVSFPAASVPISFSYTFTRDLHQGMTGSDVTELQKFLILENEGPAARALKAHGTTKNFATLTFAALKEFQSAVGIHPASGYFGPITRAYVTAAEE
jgi:peptidoglycan hydrolase-like protein with peptidoglycan-binding domain